MAEIGVRRKERGVWPWIVGLIVLALLAWLLIWLLADDDGAPVEDPVAGMVGGGPSLAHERSHESRFQGAYPGH